MDRRTVLTLSTAAVLAGLYALYGILLSPWLSPRDELFKGQRIRVGEVPLHDPESKRQAEQYLSDQPWTAAAPYQLHTGNSFVFAQDWQRLDDPKRVRFKPFAMIWRPENKKDDWLTIVSDSCVVTFAKEVVLSNFHTPPGRVVGGALEGNVSIRGEDGLAVNGRNFNFSEEAKRVWSDHPLTFAHKTNSGSAAGLELDLIPKTGPPDNDGPAVSGVRIVRLRKDVIMNIDRPAEPGKPAERVRITCAGTFEFGVETNIAEFRQDVRVNRPTGPGQFDRLKTDVLTLVLEPPSRPGGENGAPPAADKTGAEGTKFLANDDEPQFRRLLAEGPDTEVHSDRSDLRAQMQELTYDQAGRLIVLRDAKGVRLNQQDSKLVCPEITATLTEDGQLERTICRGAGQILRFVKGSPGARPADRPVEFAGQWKTQLQLGPDEDQESGLDLIELKGRATLSQPNRLALQADLVRLWVTPIRQTDGLRGRAGTDRPEEDARPKQMLAVGSAEFASPQITGRTERLEVWFEDGPLPEPPPSGDLESTVGQSASRRSSTQSVADAGRPRTPQVRREQPAIRQTARVSSAPAGARAYASVEDTTPVERRPARKQRGAAKADEKPPHLTADRIRVLTMIDGKEDPQIATVVAEGKVEVVQDRKPGEKPFHLQGDRLRLENYSERHQIVHLFGEGTSAQIADRQLQVEGRNIHFDRGRNFARVTGAGMLRLPMPKDPFGGKPVAAAGQLDVFWNEEMTFDGETAKFLKNVRTQFSDSEVRCEEMHVTLTARIDFAEDEQKTEPDVRTILCRDNVQVISREYEGNRLNQRRVAGGAEFFFDKTTGETTARGPGHVLLWSRGAANTAGLGAGQSVAANRPRGEPDSSEWGYSRIDFVGRMQGNIQQDRTEFHQRVKIVYGPVASATEVVDIEHLPQRGGWMTCRQLELMQHKPAGTEAYLTAVGRGNVMLEGQAEQGQFHANAETVTYDQSKGLYTLKGDGRRDATVYHEKRAGVGKPGDVVAAQRMEFIPARNMLRITQSPGGQASP